MHLHHNRDKRRELTPSLVMAHLNSFTTPRAVERSTAPTPPSQAWLLSAVDLGLATAIFLTPWCMGGRHPLGELALVVVAVLTSIAWMLRPGERDGSTRWTRSPADWIFAAALTLVAGQLAPWPEAARDVLSPHLRGLLPLWSQGESTWGVWHSISLTPSITQDALALLLAYGLLFFTALQRIQRVEDVERVVRWVAGSATLMAGFGLLQYLTSNGKFLWFYHHPARDTWRAVTGMYVNKNHFAHFLALGVGPVVWCLQHSLRVPHGERHGGQSRQAWHAMGWTFALGLIVFAGLMSLSRGGIAVMGLALMVCGGAYYHAGLLSRRMLLSAVAVLGIVGCSLAIHGHQAVTERLDDYGSGTLNELDKDGNRRRIWSTDLKAALDYAVLGSGAGSHREIYPTYLEETLDVELTHAENGYLQIALELGVPGLALLLCALAYVGRWCAIGVFRAPSRRAMMCAAAVAASLLVSAVHSLVDFVWYIPSCMVVALLLAACGWRLALLAQPHGTCGFVGVPRRMAWAVAVCVAVTGAWMAERTARATLAAPHWDAYLEYAFSAKGRAGEPAGEDVIEHLRRVVAWTPGDARGHLRLSAAYLQQFETLQSQSRNAMPLNQIRDAAIASRFASRSELDAWLSRAVGDHRRLLDIAQWHARQALEHCPLQGEAYTYLAELQFLNGPPQVTTAALVAQALRVRPFSGPVLLCAGSEAALANDFAGAFECWRRALRAGETTQRHLIDLWVSAGVPAQVILAEFRPDPGVVRLMEPRYRKVGDDLQYRAILEYHRQLADEMLPTMTGETASQLCLELFDVQRQLGDSTAACRALERGIELAPNDFAMRSALGSYLAEREQYAEAEPHLRWCVERRPNDDQIKSLLAIAVKGRIDGARVSARHTSPTRR